MRRMLAMVLAKVRGRTAQPQAVTWERRPGDQQVAELEATFNHQQRDIDNAIHYMQALSTLLKRDLGGHRR